MIRRVVCFIVIYFLCVITCYQSTYAAVSPPVPKSPATPLSLNYAPIPLWQGMFTDLKNWKINNWKVNKLPSWGSKNIQVRASTSANGTSPHGDNYLRIRYPAGSANSGASPPLPLGGAQFYGAMIDSSTPITMSFFIRFPTNFPFDFVKPTTSSPYTIGKLPGLFGGTGNTGNHVPTGTDGWTTRYMWCDYVESTRKKVRAGGELLLFTPGSNKGLYGHSYGTHVGCNNWHFSADGQWHNLQQTIHLNDPGVANGRIDVCYDGNLVLTETNVTFRTVDKLNIDGILFQSFFGGSGADYATPTSTYIDFADFALYPYPATAAPGACISNP
jgi:hypothetical protein